MERLVLAHPGLNWPIPASAAQEVGVAQPFLHVKVPWAQAVGAVVKVLHALLVPLLHLQAPQHGSSNAPLLIFVVVCAKAVIYVFDGVHQVLLDQLAVVLAQHLPAVQVQRLPMGQLRHAVLQGARVANRAQGAVHHKAYECWACCFEGCLESKLGSRLCEILCPPDHPLHTAQRPSHRLHSSPQRSSPHTCGLSHKQRQHHEEVIWLHRLCSGCRWNHA
mmetsp:Transcript_13761/g.37175  ORF Transcript_13761/g.37175 Transcript_13761/m.37175 type:complete len:220 (-) Transcript_13761:623-1282(-)